MTAHEGPAVKGEEKLSQIKIILTKSAVLSTDQRIIQRTTLPTPGSTGACNIFVIYIKVVSKNPSYLTRYGLPPVSEFLTDDARAAACARR